MTVWEASDPSARSAPTPPLAQAPGALWLLLASAAWIGLASVLLSYDQRLSAFTTEPKLDLRFGYSLEAVRELFANYGPEGRELYRQSTWLDMAYALVVGLCGSHLARVLVRAPRWRWLARLPWVFAVTDFAENLLLLRLLDTRDELSAALVAASSAVTALKLLALVPTLGIALFSAISASSRMLAGQRGRTSPFSAGERSVLRLGGLVLALALSVVQSRVWNGPEAPGWMSTLVPDNWLAPQAEAYESYGRWFVVVMLILAALSYEPDARGFRRWQQRLVLLALFADIGTYWIAGWDHPQLRAFTFWGVEVPAWAALGLGNLVWGLRAWLRGERREALGPLALLPAMLLSAAVLRYLPHALALPALALSPWLSAPVPALRERTRRSGKELLGVLLLAAGVLALLGFSACAGEPRFEPRFPEESAQPQSVSQPGEVLVVLSSAHTQTLQDGSTRATGTFLGEFYESYRALTEAGYRVVVATPSGTPPAIDPESLETRYWSEPSELQAARALLNTPLLASPLSLAQAQAGVESYQGMVVPGGQGVMIDLLEDTNLHELLAQFERSQRPIGLVCHAPALLLRLSTEARRLDSLSRRSVTSVSAFEEFYIETFVMGADAQVRGIGAQLDEHGFEHHAAFPGSSHAERDCNLVTSQNPFSGPDFNELYLAALSDWRRGARCVEAGKPPASAERNDARLKAGVGAGTLD